MGALGRFCVCNFRMKALQLHDLLGQHGIGRHTSMASGLRGIAPVRYFGRAGGGQRALADRGERQRNTRPDLRPIANGSLWMHESGKRGALLELARRSALCSGPPTP